MADTDHTQATADARRRARAGRRLVAVGIGLALGAVGLTAYAFATRVPDGGRSADTLGAANSALAMSIVFAVITTAAVFWVGLNAAAGHRPVAHAALLLGWTVLATAYAYLSPTPDSAAGAISGPGARPAVSVSQMAWPLLVVAALLLLMATLRPADLIAWSRAVLALASPFTAIGVVIAVVAGVVAGWAWERGQVPPTTVDSIAIPPMPTAVGSTVAYRLSITKPDRLVPAGPGFVVWGDGAMAAYDGETGAPRWRVSPETFPAGCKLSSVRATGTAPDSVVVAECTRPRLRPMPSAHRDVDYKESVLTGFDANTGRLLWLNDQNLKFATGAGQSAIVVAVAGPGGIGSLDPRSGKLRWATPGATNPCADYANVVHEVVVVVPCFESTTIRALNGITGAERSIALPLPALPDPSQLDLTTLAADGDTLVLRSRIQQYNPAGGRAPTQYTTLAVDIASNTASLVPSVDDSSPQWPVPGPLLQLARDGGPTRDDFIDIYSVADRRLIRVSGVTTRYSSIPDAYRWLRLGDRMVTDATAEHDRGFMSVIAADGSVERQPSPCETDGGGAHGGGLLPVPGAVLALCPQRSGSLITSWDVIGLH